MNSPLFSVIIPACNAARTIGSTIASVRAQTLGDHEILVVDDGSCDETVRMALDALGGDRRGRVISIANGGVSAARNLGVELTRGPLIAFLDADDLWAEDKLAAHAELHAANPQLAASYARVAFIASTAMSLETRSRSTVRPGLRTIADLLGENPVCTTSNLVTTRAAFLETGGFDSTMQHAEDQEWQLRAVSKRLGIAGIDRTLTGYRFSEDGLSADLRAMHEGWVRLAKIYGDESEPRAHAIFYRYLARRSLRSVGKSGDAIGFALSGIRTDAPAFFSERRRGLLTLVGALASPFLPAPLRARLFA